MALTRKRKNQIGTTMEVAGTTGGVVGDVGSAVFLKNAAKGASHGHGTKAAVGIGLAALVPTAAGAAIKKQANKVHHRKPTTGSQTPRKPKPAIWGVH